MRLYFSPPPMEAINKRNALFHVVQPTLLNAHDLKLFSDFENNDIQNFCRFLDVWAGIHNNLIWNLSFQPSLLKRLYYFEII